MAEKRRLFIGKVAAVTRRQRVYQTPDSLEVDDSEGSLIRRSRLFYDEIELVTHHRRIGWMYVVLGGLLGTFAGLMALILAASKEWGATAVFALVALALGGLAVFALASPLDVVTAYGRRTHAQVEFLVRRRHAREIYERLCDLAREHQERLARELAAEDQARALPSDGS